MEIRAKKHMTTSLVFSVITIGLSIVFVLFLHTGVIGIFFAQAIGGLFSLILGFLFSRSSYIFYFNWLQFKELLKFSLPLVPSGIAVFILTFIDRIVIKTFMTLSDLGLYGIGFRISSVIALLNRGISSATTPLIYSNFKNDSAPVEIERIFRYTLFIYLISISVLALFSKELLVLMTTPKFYSAYIIVPFLAIARVFSGMYVFFPGLEFAKKTKTISVITSFGAILNICLNILFIFIWGLVGIAFATVLSSVTILIIRYILSQKYYYIPYNIKIIISSFIVTIAIVLLGVNLTMNYAWIFKIFLVAVLILLLFIFKVITPAEFSHIRLKILNKISK